MSTLSRTRSHGLRIALAATLLCANALERAEAGTVITTGLPSGTVIVNIDGQADGAANYSGPNADDWYLPFNVNNQLLQVTVQPGTYSFRVVNQADAASLFPSLTSAQLGQIGGAWTYNSPWATDYLAFDMSAVGNSSQHQLFTGAVTDNGYGYGTAAIAYQQALSNGYYNQIVTGSGRYTGSTATSYTFTTAQTLVFAVPDYYLPDNNGIISVVIASVPEPSGLLMMCAALVGMVGVTVFRRRRSQADGALPNAADRD